MAQTQQLDRVAAFVESRFPKQFLIPVADFSALAGLSYGRARNDICRGSFPVTLVRQGKRNYVAAPDAVAYLAGLWAGPVATNGTDETEQLTPRRVGAPVKDPAAKARAAVARAAKRAKRAAKQAAASVQEGGAA